MESEGRINKFNRLILNYLASQKKRKYCAGNVYKKHLGVWFQNSIFG